MSDLPWDRLLAQLEFAREPWFGFVFASSRRAVAELQDRAREALRWRARRVEVLPVATIEDLANASARAIPAVAEVDLVWVDATTVVAGGRQEEWDAAWRRFAGSLNGQRDALLRKMAGGLVVSGPVAAKAVFRGAAPDLWSMRAIVIELANVRGAVTDDVADRQEPAASPVREASLSITPNGVDDVARQLLAGATAALRRNEPDLAVERATRAVEAFEAQGTAADDLITALTVLSRANEAAGDPPIASTQRALALAPRDPTVRIELLDRLGRSLFRVGELAGARAAYEESLALCRRLAVTDTPEARRDLAWVEENLRSLPPT